MGKVSYRILEAEKNSRIFKRSIYASKDIKTGESFTPENTKVIRPALGMSPKYWDRLLTQKAEKDIKAGEPVLYISDMPFHLL